MVVLLIILLIIYLLSPMILEAVKFPKHLGPERSLHTTSSSRLNLVQAGGLFIHLFLILSNVAPAYHKKMHVYLPLKQKPQVKRPPTCFIEPLKS